MEKTYILEAKDISIGYTNKKNSTTVASNVSISLEKGKLTALIGANGIGKSTLLRTLIGIQWPLSGTVYLENKDIHSLDNLTLAQYLSVVLTDKLPPSNLTVFELIALG
ncbi:MAG TPA: ABC transporter ATP-binding protein, partial [Flavobacterium sp.]|nr:ABC transporter ATP-binding protein [Flavobacterium sp.]